MKHCLRFISLALTVTALLVTVGCNTSSKKKDYTTMVARFLIEANAHDSFATVTLPVSGVRISVNNRPIITEFDFTGVELAQADLGQFLVFKLTPQATRDLYRITGSNQGKRLVLFINGIPVGARTIDGALNTGAIEVFAAIPEAELPALVKNLNSTSIDMQIEIAKKN